MFVKNCYPLFILLSLFAEEFSKSIHHIAENQDWKKQGWNIYLINFLLLKTFNLYRHTFTNYSKMKHLKKFFNKLGTPIVFPMEFQNVKKAN